MKSFNSIEEQDSRGVKEPANVREAIMQGCPAEEAVSELMAKTRLCADAKLSASYQFASRLYSRLQADPGELEESIMYGLDAMKKYGGKDLFYFPNNDRYSAIDFDRRKDGANGMESILGLYEDMHAERFDEEATILITSLVLNRELTAGECALVCGAVALCNYLASHAKGKRHGILRPLIIADNSYPNDRLEPVQVTLFLMNGRSEEVEAFMETRL